jgi:hypothetical protein
MASFSNNRLIRPLFFGNYFYGICAVALSVESSLQQELPLNGPVYYLLIFCATVVYYTQAYLLTETSGNHHNARAEWYARHQHSMRLSQRVLGGLIVLCLAYYLLTALKPLMHLSLSGWILAGIFPCCSLLYYGVESRYFGRITLRAVGWLKPFLIGFTWSGLVTIYPVIFDSISRELSFSPDFVTLFLFIKNMMFISILCILFDIKDYAMDYNNHLKTLVVNLGLRKTIFYIILPLCITGLFAFWLYASARGFPYPRIFINTLPFICIILVSYSMHIRRSIFYYLIIIDGLMLIKALCGITAALFF